MGSSDKSRMETDQKYIPVKDLGVAHSSGEKGAAVSAKPTIRISLSGIIKMFFFLLQIMTEPQMLCFDFLLQLF